MSAAFTPGPWSVCGNGKCSCKAVWCDDHPIAEVVHGEWGDDYPAIRFIETDGMSGTAVEAFMEQITYGEIDQNVAKANARLISAAPELYEACALLDAYLYATDAADSNEGQIVRAALRKARGEQQ